MGEVLEVDFEPTTQIDHGCSASPQTLLNKYMDTKQRAINLLISATKVGQARGIFTLEEAEVLAQAIRELTPKEEKKEVAKEEIKEQNIRKR